MNIFSRLRRLSFLEGRLAYFEQRVRDLETEKTILEDRLKASLEDRNALWALVNKSLDEMKYSYQSQINKEWAKAGEAAPYPEAAVYGDGKRYEMPKNPFAGQTMIPSAMAHKVTQDFIKREILKMDEAQG